MTIFYTMEMEGYHPPLVVEETWNNIRNSIIQTSIPLVDVMLVLLTIVLIT